jgi:hypothetical protein
MDKEVRLKQIPVGTIEALQYLADCRGYSLEDALRDAVNTEVYINQQLEKGGEILCKDKDGVVRRVVLTHMSK